MRRALLSLVAVLLLVVAGTVGIIVAALPPTHSALTVAGLTGTTAITYDADGIPHIAAATLTDAAAALGVAHARDRLFQMEMMRRAASGTLSELVGGATLPLDKLTRTLALRRQAEADLPRLPPVTRALLEAYAAGVNAWTSRRGRWASAEFVAIGPPAPWTPVDSLLWGKLMALWLSANWRTELARLDAKEARLLPRFPQPFTLPSTASNAWALDGRHTATGAPLLAGDPHLSFALPGVWYLARVDTPEGIRVGATAPGVPFLVIGHNGRIAWTFTTTGADTEDLFVETEVAGGYLTPEGPRPFETRTETIHVRGAPDVTLAVRQTRHGPVIQDAPVLALAAAATGPDTAAAGLAELATAASVAEAGGIAPRISAPVQNLIVADRQTIGLFTTGRVPIRRTGDGSRPVPGADGAHDWTGFATGDALPHSVAPASGRIVNANDQPVPTDFPVFLGRDWPGDWRARRIAERLDALPHATAVDFVAIQKDALSLFARELRPVLRRTTPSAGARPALAMLDGWDGTMAADRPQPLLFNVWIRHIAARLPDDGWRPPAERVAASTPDPATLTATLDEAVAEIAGLQGADPAAWRWGDAHRAVFAHPLGRLLPLPGLVARIPAPGDDTTIDRGGMAAASLDSVHGAALRAVFDLADLDRSLFMIAPGQSGQPASPSATDLVTPWRDGGTRLIPARPVTISASITLRPGEPP